MIIEEDEHLAHYGILRRSGRYPWGSGNNQSTRNASFLDYVNEMKRAGLTEAEIAKGTGSDTNPGFSEEHAFSTTTLRALKTIAKAQQRQEQIGQAQRLKDKGNSNVAIGRRLGIPEPTVRNLLKPGAKDKADQLTSMADMLKRQVADKTFVDIGAGVETHLGVSKERLNVAVAMLREEGYTVHTGIKIKQVGTGLDTDLKILAPKNTTWGDVQRNKDNIRQIQEFSDDHGRTFAKTHDPLIVNPNRVAVKYAADGGAKADGVIYVRPGVEDVSIGKARYAQVRIQVGEGHYLKGMAVYRDDLPAGTDLVFNTNKDSTGNKLDAMKSIKADKDLPFGSITHQIIADAGTPHERVTSAMNIVGSKPGSGEEGDWKSWGDSLSSQFLAKQSPSLARKQLDVTAEQKQKDFDEISTLTNPVVKKKLLKSFADGTDAAAVELDAAALSRDQGWHVILPVSSMKPNEIHAPNYADGTHVALVRYPHGGTFEIPELVVNNKNKEAKSMIGNAEDAVGIHHSVAERLSGADFDGDTVIVIPNNQRKVRSTPALEGLKNFDPIRAYPKYDGMKVMDSVTKGHEMGSVSNLITDMTVRGAPAEDLARAIKHSMVVIDAEKHELNWKQSEIDQGIRQLKQDYQTKPTNGKSKGASTLLSRATSEIRVPQRKLRKASEGGGIDPTTGEKVYTPTGHTYVDKSGKTVVKTESSQKLAETTDAHTLSSGTPIEKIYADYSNRMKALANKARLAWLDTPNLEYSPSAAKAYAPEVKSLTEKLALSKMNAPYERQAQIIARSVIKAKRQSDPSLDGDKLKKVEFKALEDARIRTGANKKERQIQITQEEWNAIQSGAISNNRLEEILTNTDLEALRKLATPRTPRKMTATKTARARDMLAIGYTKQQVAQQLGVSVSTLSAAVKDTQSGGDG